MGKPSADRQVVARVSGRRVRTLARQPCAGRSARGSATLELALAIPALTAVAFGLVWVLAVGVTFARAGDAARAAARVAARGESDAAARDEATRTLPGSTAQLLDVGDTSGTGEHVRVVVTYTMAAPIGWLHGLSVDVTGSASAWRETL